MNESALSYWRYTGYTRQDLVGLCSRIDKTHHAALVDILPGGGRAVTVTSRVGETDQGHVISTLRYLNDVWVYAAEKLGTQLKGPVLLWLEDGVWESDREYTRVSPFFAFGRCISDPHSFLIPDAAFIESKGYEQERLEIEKTEETLPWHRKKAMAYWRGATSGVTRITPWQDAPRAKLVLRTRGETLPLDASFTSLDVTPPHDAYFSIREQGLLSAPVPFSEFLNYRYLIDVDGHHCAWRSLFLKLLSKSAVIKIRSNYCEWYYDRLSPWVHYIPLGETLAEIKEILEWCQHHDDKVREIGSSGQTLGSTIIYESEVRRSALLLREVLSFCRE